MAFTHGKNAKFKVEDQSSVLRDISAYLTSAGLSRSVDTAEVTTLGDSDKAYIPGLRDATIPIDGKWDPAVDEHLTGILGSVVNFEYYPEGDASGAVMYSGQCILTSYEASADVGDAVGISGQFQVTGGITRGTVP